MQLYWLDSFEDIQSNKDENTKEEIVLDETGSAYFRYNSSDSPDELIRKYKIRFNEDEKTKEEKNKNNVGFKHLNIV